ISINEEEAAKVVNRLWDMMASLPEHLRNETKVLKPQKNFRPNLHIELEHANGQISYVTGLPSTKKAGHGETAAARPRRAQRKARAPARPPSLVLGRHPPRHEYARESWKALVPTTSAG